MRLLSLCGLVSTLLKGPLPLVRFQYPSLARCCRVPSVLGPLRLPSSKSRACLFVGRGRAGALFADLPFLPQHRAKLSHGGVVWATVNAADGFTIALWSCVFPHTSPRISPLAGGSHAPHPVTSIALQRPRHIERDGVPDIAHINVTS